MSFGTGTGPPATDKQIGYLESLLRKAGHTSWAEARRALNLSPKQGRGKFTKFEASALIDQLTGGDDTPSAIDVPSEPSNGLGDDGRTEPLAKVPVEMLAAELRRRGWTVTPPGRSGGGEGRVQG